MSVDVLVQFGEIQLMFVGCQSCFLVENEKKFGNFDSSSFLSKPKQSGFSFNTT